MTRTRRWAAMLVYLAACCCCSVSVQGTPPGFIEELVVGGFDLPVGVAFGPNDRMFVWEKGGKVWIVEDGVVASDPLIDLSDEVNVYWTRGLTHFALHPDYEANGVFYVNYTDASGDTVVARYTVSAHRSPRAKGSEICVTSDR